MRLNEPADCVSDLALDQWASGELDALTRDQTANHVLSCQRCQARHQAFERQRAEFLAAAPSFAVHAQKFVPQRASRAARAFEAKRRPPLLAAGVIAIAAAIAFMLLPSSHETRLKGGLSFGYFVKRQGRVWAADSGTLLEPGDLVRFTYSSEHACYLALFGQDARATQVYFPNGARAAFVRGGAAVPLDFSVELDATPGEEHVHALFCDSSIELAPLRAALAETGRLAPPEGCKVQTLSLRKAGPR